MNGITAIAGGTEARTMKPVKYFSGNLKCMIAVPYFPLV